MKNEYNCIKCNKIIYMIDFGVDNSNVNQCCWNDGMVTEIEAGYGSTLDGNKYIIAICDDCMIELEELKKVDYIGNYIDDYIHGYIEKHKKKNDDTEC